MIWNQTRQKILGYLTDTNSNLLKSTLNSKFVATTDLGIDGWIGSLKWGTGRRPLTEGQTPCKIFRNIFLLIFCTFGFECRDSSVGYQVLNIKTLVVNRATIKVALQSCISIWRILVWCTVRSDESSYVLRIMNLFSAFLCRIPRTSTASPFPISKHH